MLRLLAPAKVNLTFEVLGRRGDGYHEVRTILQSLSLADELTFEASNDLSLTVEPEGAAPVEENLVLARAPVHARWASRQGRDPPDEANTLWPGASEVAAATLRTALLGLRRHVGVRPRCRRVA